MMLLLIVTHLVNTTRASVLSSASPRTIQPFNCRFLIAEPGVVLSSGVAQSQRFL